MVISAGLMPSGELPMQRRVSHASPHQGNPAGTQALSQLKSRQSLQSCYSMRSAFIGEMDAARFAGMMAAKNEQIASAPAATVRATGSQEETP